MERNELISFGAKQIKEKKGDIWKWLNKADCIVVTINCYVRRDNKLVMGMGTARQLKEMMPDIDIKAGQKVKEHGRDPFIIHTTPFGTNIVLFPVKPEGGVVTDPEKQLISTMKDKYKKGDWAPGWAFKADLEMIEHSMKKLVEMANMYGWKTIVMPRVGCGAGELEWSTVKKVVEKYIDDRFLIVDRTVDDVKRSYLSSYFSELVIPADDEIDDETGNETNENGAYGYVQLELFNIAELKRQSESLVL